MKAKVYNNTLQITSAYKHISRDTVQIFDVDFQLRQIRNEEYEWICCNLPELAPKSIGSYTRVKNAKNATYLKIKDEANKKGKMLLD